MTPPRTHIVHEVLEAALDADDADIVAACRRLITANLRGWRKHHDPADFARIRTFYDHETTAEQ